MIAAYNQPGYIMQAVESSLAQDYQNLEVIVSDDSTNSETEDILKSFKSDSRLAYYKNLRNIGRVGNYRKLLYEYANGEWVVMLDGDDYYTDPGYISTAVELIGKSDRIVLVGAGIKIDREETGESYSYNLGTETKIFDGKEVFTKYKKIPNHQTDIYKRSVATELDFYRHPSIGSDSESLYRLCLRGDVGYIARDVAVWRVHHSNTTYSRSLKVQIKEADFFTPVYSDALHFIKAEELKDWKNSMEDYTRNHLLDIAIKERKTGYVWMLLLKYFRQFGAKTSLIHLLKYHGIIKTHEKRK